jgi:hypothetical protein
MLIRRGKNPATNNQSLSWFTTIIKHTHKQDSICQHEPQKTENEVRWSVICQHEPQKTENEVRCSERLCQEEFEDTKGVIRIRISKKEHAPSICTCTLIYWCLRYLTRNQDNVSEWGDMAIRGLLFQWTSSIKIQLSV